MHGNKNDNTINKEIYKVRPKEIQFQLHILLTWCIFFFFFLFYMCTIKLRNAAFKNLVLNFDTDLWLISM